METQLWFTKMEIFLTLPAILMLRWSTFVGLQNICTLLRTDSMMPFATDVAFQLLVFVH